MKAIPSTLAENSGLDQVDILAELISRHSEGHIWIGIDVQRKKVDDMLKQGVLEPTIVKEYIIKLAAEAAIMILRIDDTIESKREREVQPPKPEERPFIGPPPPSGPMHPYGDWKSYFGKSPYPPEWEEEWYETHSRWEKKKE
jgi:hypothetical protein